MNRRGVSYDVGRVMYGNWRPVFDPTVVHRELEIPKNDLHCNAVRICGRDVHRLMTAAEDALRQGLEVWLSPELWDKSQDETRAYLTKAAAAAEHLRARWPDRLVLVVGGELTLFMQGIVPGRNVAQRMGNPANWEFLKAGGHNTPLNEFLARTTTAVRAVFGGPLTYASLPWEAVEWNAFDFVGVDHYRAAQIRDRYVEMLEPAFSHAKPVVILEFGSRTYRGADTSTEGMAGDIADYRSLWLHQIPLVGRLVRPRLRSDHVRDEDLQARDVSEMLGLLDGAGVEGAFVMTFVSPIAPTDDDPRYDLDMNSYSLVKTYTNRNGATYPDMPWEPKASFRTVSSYYAGASPSPRSL
jgi:hypothetical protein